MSWNFHFRKKVINVDFSINSFFQGIKLCPLLTDVGSWMTMAAHEKKNKSEKVRIKHVRCDGEKIQERFNFQFRVSFLLLSLSKRDRSAGRASTNDRSKRRRWRSRFETRRRSLCRNNNWIVIVVGDGSTHFSAPVLLRDRISSSQPAFMRFSILFIEACFIKFIRFFGATLRVAILLLNKIFRKWDTKVRIKLWNFVFAGWIWYWKFTHETHNLYELQPLLSRIF